MLVHGCYGQSCGLTNSLELDKPCVLIANREFASQIAQEEGQAKRRHVSDASLALLKLYDTSTEAQGLSIAVSEHFVASLGELVFQQARECRMEVAGARNTLSAFS